MGIQGLLPLLKSIMVPIHIKDLQGCSVAIDTYSWLHKGALSCSKELCKGQPTSKHINYCMHRVNLLRHHGVRPILVFDGGHLPMKTEQENKRARARKENLARAIEHESGGNSASAYECYQKAVDISPSIAYELIQVLKQENVCYVVAPYEADAQMTFLAVSKQVDAVITEDSDLIPFGCPRIIYKMDKFGQGVEFRSSVLHQNKELNFTGFTKQMFLEMCILSGCDYLQSLPGMGLKKAHTFIKKFKSYDKVIKHLKYNNVAVPPLYEESFKKAILTFQHQRVYDPITEDIVHLSDLSDNVGEEMDFLGPSIPQDIAKGIATGDLDPFTKMPFQGECVRDALVLDGTYQPKSIQHEGERKKIDLPAQKNLLTNYFCFASLEAKRKFRVPRVTPNHPSLRSETHPGEEINETAISYNINCSPATLTYSGNMGIVDPTKNPVDNGVATKSSASLELLTHDDKEDDLRSPQRSLPHRSRHSIHPCIVVNKERQCNFSSDAGDGKMRIEQKNVTVRSSYFHHKSTKENCPDKIGKLLVKDDDSTTRCESGISECEFKSASDTGEGEAKLEDRNPILRSSSFQIKTLKAVDQEKANGTLLVKNAAAADTHGQSSIIPNRECKSASDAAQHKTRVETRKVIVRSSYFQQKTGKENDQDNKFDKLKDGVATDTCENSIPENISGNNYFKGTIKRKFAPDDNVQTELLNHKCLRTNGPLLIQSTGISNPEDSAMETEDKQDKFGCNISHLGQYSDIAEKSMEKFVSVISSFRCTSGSRASGLRAPLKDVRNTCTNRLSDTMDLSKFAYVPTKRKPSPASRR